MTEQELNKLIELKNPDQIAAINFCEQLLKKWMRRNLVLGITIQQSLWVFSRFEEFKIDIDGQQMHIDIYKLFQSGAVPTLYYCMTKIQPDDMTKSYHWLTQECIDWVKNQIEEFIEPETVAYIKSIQI